MNLKIKIMNELILHCIIFFAGCLFVLILKETGVLSKFEKYAYRKKFDKLADEHLIKLSEAGKKGSAIDKPGSFLL